MPISLPGIGNGTSGIPGMNLWKIFGGASRKEDAPVVQEITSREANDILAAACQKGDLRRAEYALKQSASPNLFCDRGYFSNGYWQTGLVPMLWDAAHKNNPPMAQLLLKYGAEVDRAYSGTTPLTVAVLQGRTPIVRMLLDAGATLDSRYEGQSLLGVAKEKQYADVIKMLEDEQGRRAAVAEAARQVRAEEEEKRAAQIAAAAERAANPVPETDQAIQVMKPLSLKGAATAKKKGFFR